MDAQPPKVPMSPSQLPQQREVEVIEMPVRPDTARFEVGYRNYTDQVAPKQGVPRPPIYLFQSEWAASPFHGGVSGWYLHGRRDYWLLWQRSLDDNTDPWTWDWSLVGYCDRRGIEERTAAMHLVFEFWKQQCEEAKRFKPLFDWINEEGLLSVDDVKSIRRGVVKQYL